MYSMDSQRKSPGGISEEKTTNNGMSAQKMDYNAELTDEQTYENTDFLGESDGTMCSFVFFCIIFTGYIDI